MNEFTVRLDLAKGKARQQQTVFVRQGDKNATTIVATITDHGVAASTSGMTARFSMRLPNGTEYYRKTATLSGNVATVTIDEAQAASAVGRTDVAYFQLLQGSTVVASTESFTVVVLPDALADATVPESYDSAIQEAIDNANEAADAAWEAAQQPIPDGSVTTVKLASNAVTADKIADAVRKGYVRSFETVAAMQAATDLKAGMTCHTNGFHASGDGGAAYYTVSASGTANGMDVLALQGGLFATNVDLNPNVLNYGYTDDLGAIVNYMFSKFDTVEVPDGTYQLLTPIYLKNSSTLRFGATANVYFNGISAITNNTYPLLYANVIGGRFYGTNKTGIAIDLKQARHCTIEGVYITNVDKGIVLDGQATWCASNTLINPTMYLFNTGIHLTADSGHQTNNTVIFGGHLLDSGSDSTATALLLDASGDTNKCFGLAVEDCAIGFDSQSITSNVPLLLVGCRAENIKTYTYRCNSSSRRNIIIGCSFTDQSGKMSIGARWNQDLDLRNIDNSFLSGDGNGLYFYDSNHSLRKFLFYDAEEKKMKLIPYGLNQKVAIGGTDSSQVRKEYIVVGGADGLVFPQGKLTLKSSTSGSSKYFKVTVDDSGAISATEVTLS